MVIILIILIRSWLLVGSSLLFDLLSLASIAAGTVNQSTFSSPFPLIEQFHRSTTQTVNFQCIILFLWKLTWNRESHQCCLVVPRKHVYR
jgi:hypothetical protein